MTEDRVPLRVKITSPPGASPKEEEEAAQAIIDLARLLDPEATVKIVRDEA